MSKQADPIIWKDNLPVWVEQWPLSKEKLEAATKLVQEQLQLGHIEPSNSPWNTPIFVIKKKSGKWRLLQDLRAVNNTMKTMGALQPAWPSFSCGCPLRRLTRLRLYYSISQTRQVVICI